LDGRCHAITYDSTPFKSISQEAKGKYPQSQKLAGDGYCAGSISQVCSRSVCILIWWILNRRARMKKNPESANLVSNQIFFYCNSLPAEKIGLLESLNVKVKFPVLKYSEDKWTQNEVTGVISVKSSILWVHINKRN
jgi:hypothetical protein